MALLLNCRSIAKVFGSRTVFQNISFTVEEGDRWGLIGPNGAGKSTFLQILAGLVEPDSGECSVRKLTRMAYVPQSPEFPAERTVHDLAAEPLAALELDEDERTARIHRTLGQCGFQDETAAAGTLSGGWRKRLAIARGLIVEPDVLLLDEPTNHLDLEGILWLEGVLAGAPFASVTVSHDRYFLENVANHMSEISISYPDGLYKVEGNYSRFLERKEEFLLAEAKRQEALENLVRREIEWLRRGAKARTSKSKARIDTAGEMIRELAEMNARAARGPAFVEFTASGRKTKRLMTVDSVSKTMGGRELFRGLSFALFPGVKLGLLGANGSGKTTLLKLLDGSLTPDAGSVERADLLQVVTFDQNREQLDPAVTLRRSLCPEGDSVIFRGRPIHVAGWAKRFLFRQEQLDLPVGRLSGGEQARVQIARLMLRPADVLLLDEPTNDLDIPTLEVLEESLDDFDGAMVLVTHDRYLLDRVSNVVLGLGGAGEATVFADYSQWQQAQSVRRQSRAAKEPAPAAVAAPAQKKRLSYLEAREWDGMEAAILSAEHELGRSRSGAEEAALSGDARRIEEAYERLRQAQARVDALFERWAELEAKLAG